MSTLSYTRRDFLKTIGLGAASLAMPGCLGAAQRRGRRGKGPNIVLIMADDMGYSDIGCYGGEIHTPNLDKLAANGLRFTQFYNTARCCPTRASLMTGLYPHQTGMGWMTAANLGYEGYRGDLNNKCVTIAEVLKRAGYKTYMAGKWHLVYDEYWDGPKHSWPRQRGFDRFYGTISGSGSFYKPHTLTRDNTRIEAPKKGYYYTDAISDNASKFITQHSEVTPDAPFFLYVAYTAPHWPLHAKAEDIARYRGKYKIGWDEVRRRRHERMIDMGIVDEAWAMTPRDEEVKPWDQVNEVKKNEMDLRMAIYAAQIDCMDQGIGRIVKTLEKTGRLDNTLILFLADNGGCAEMLQFGEMEDVGEGIGMSYDKFIALLGTDDTFASYGISWANVSNTPFRRYKHWVHEGGIATPLIVHWPVRIKSGGKLRHQPGHLIDIMTTCVDVAGAKYPSRYNGNEITPMEGKSLVPAFDNKPIKREAIYWEHEANRAIRAGKWKLVLKHPGRWELYDIEADRTELNDLAEKYPERVRKLAAMWQSYAERANVLPLDGRSWEERVEE
jgi:arylsulfatase A-like enzyme